MLITILNWIYITLTCFITGSFALHAFSAAGSHRSINKDAYQNNSLSREHGEYKGLNPGSCIVCGFCVLTAYAGYFSLFAGVGLAANIVLIIVCICIAVLKRKAYVKYIRDISGTFSGSAKGKMRTLKTAYCLAAVIIIIVGAYYTAAGRFAFDTGTYHAQSIHWIESFGVIKGLAYMQTRLGFNSSYFCLCALYSMHFLGQSLHTLSGFLAVFVMLYSLTGYFRHICCVTDTCGERMPVVVRLRVTDFAYAAPFAYFIITAVEIISPSTDHGVIWLIIWLCLRWLELLEENREGRQGYALLCVMAVFLVSVKLSVGVLALLVIRPAYLLIREKRVSEIIKYILAGVVLVLPYFIRNVIITGWIIYPFPAIDLFAPDWKIPVEGVRYEADEIVVWARYTKDTALIDQSIREWFPVWWSEQGAANRYLSLSAFTGALVLAVRIAASLIYSIYLWINGKKGRLIAIPPGVKEHSEYVYFGIILLLSFIFFMASAPSNRFGYGYILLIPLFAAGDMSVNVIPVFLHKPSAPVTRDTSAKPGICIQTVFAVAAAAAVTVFICLDMLKGLYMFASDDRHYLTDTGLLPAVIRQKDYPEADAGVKEWQGMQIYYPKVEGEQIWYHAFPAILYEGNLEGIERRGNSIKDGFRLSE